MDITFLGTGSAFNPVMENSNAIFTIGERLYLVDCGETAFGKLWNLPAYLRCSGVTVLVTHLHSDHVGSLGSLISYSHYVARKEVLVVHPVETIVRFLDLVGIDRSIYGFARALPGGTTTLDGKLALRPIEVEHVEGMRCFGYLVEDGESRIWFSGDSRAVPAEVLERLKDGRIDRLYQDTCLRQTDHPTHASLAYLEALIPPQLRPKVFCIHLDCDCRDLLRQKGFGQATTL